MSNEQRNILKLDEEILKHAAPIKHNWSMNDTSKNYGEATNTQYGHVIISTNLNNYDSELLTVPSTEEVAQAINQLTNEKAVKNHKSETTDYGVATDSEYGHVKVDKKLEDSTNPVRNSAIYSAINDINENVETIVSSLGENTEGIKKLLSLSKPTEFTNNIDNLIDAGFYIYKSETEKVINANNYLNNALIFVLKEDTRVIQHVYPTKKIYKENSDEFAYKLNGSQYTRFGITANEDTEWSMFGVSFKPYTETNLVKTIKAKNASVKVYENTSGFTIEWEQLNDKQSYEIVADELYAYETICEFNDLPIKGNFLFGNLIGKCDIRISSKKMEIRSTLNTGNIIKNIHQCFFVPRM